MEGATYVFEFALYALPVAVLEDTHRPYEADQAEGSAEEVMPVRSATSLVSW